jgi:hypothetical protein
MAAEWGANSALQPAGKGAGLMSFYREISCALQRGNSLINSKSADRFNRSEGRHFMLGAEVPSPWGGTVKAFLVSSRFFTFVVTPAMPFSLVDHGSLPLICAALVDVRWRVLCCLL